MNTHDAKRKIACKRTASLGQREMPNPQRPHFLARVATLLSLLGENDKHCDLVSEAVNIAQAAGKPGNADAFSTNVIVELAFFDLDRAMQLITHHENRDNILMEIAARIVIKNHVKALVLYNDVSHRNACANYSYNTIGMA